MWEHDGFGRGERHGEEIAVTVEARTVNHRFLDLHTRCRPILAWERDPGIVSARCGAGKVDLHVNVRSGEAGAGLRVTMSCDVVPREAKRIRRSTGRRGGDAAGLLSVPTCSGGPRRGRSRRAPLAVAEGAVRDALGMLAAPGRRGGPDEAGPPGSVAPSEVSAGEILARRGEHGAGGRPFRERIAALSAEAGVDPSAPPEAAILLDRLDITEECDRLASHLAAVETLFRSPGEAVGKRIDFLSRRSSASSTPREQVRHARVSPSS